MAVSKEYRAYGFAQRPLSERELAGIIKHHPEERKPIMDVIIYYSRKLIQTYLDWDGDITDDKYHLFKERLEQGFVRAQENIEEEGRGREKAEKCSNCGVRDWTRDFSLADFCLDCRKYISKDAFASEKEVLYERVKRAYIFGSDDSDETIKACDAFLALVSASAQAEKSKLTIGNPGDDGVTVAVEGLVEVYKIRGKTYQKMGQHDKAIADFTDAIALNPTKTEYLEERAKAYQEKRMYDNAIADLSEALELSKYYVQSGQHEADLERIRNGEIFDPNPLPPHYSILLACVYKEMGELGKALAELNSSLEDCWGGEALLGASAEIYETMGEFQNAYDCWQKIYDDWQEGLKERQDTIAESESIGHLFEESYDTHERYIAVNLERCREKADTGGGNTLRFDSA